MADGLQIQIDVEQRDLTEKISQRFNIDQIEAFISLRRFLQSEDRSLEILVSSADSQKAPSARSAGKASASSRSAIPQHLADELLDAFNVFFFQEHLYLTRCVSALLRIAEDSDAEYFPIAQSTLPSLATSAFGSKCLQRFQILLEAPLPPQVRDAPRYSPFWAKQGLKQQLALLEVIFLLFYGHVAPDAGFVISVLTIIQQTDLGQHQANEAFFDAESVHLLSSVKHLLAFISVESLDLEKAMDGYQFSLSPPPNSTSLPLFESADSLAQALDLLEASQPDPGRSPIFLAWALVLRKVEDALVDLDTSLQSQGKPQLPAHLRRVQDILTPEDGGQPIWARLASAAFSSQLALFPTMRSMALSPLLSNSTSSSSFDVSVASSLAFRAVFKGLLLGITEVVKPEFVPDFDALVSLWEATFDASTTSDVSGGAAAGVAALSAQFWDIDYEHQTRRAVLDTASRRWPVHFRPLIRLFRALTGTCNRTTVTGTSDSVDSRAAVRVLQELGSISSLAQVLPSAARTLRPPWEVIESADYRVLDYRAVQPIPLFGSRVVIQPGTCGRMVSELGKQPVVVVWELQDNPISGWRLIRDVLASFVRLLPDDGIRPSRSRPDDEDPFGPSSSRPVADFSTLSPDTDDNAAVATEILDLFAAVLAGAPDQAGQLLDHLDFSGQNMDPDESIDSGARTFQPSLVAVTQRILDQALATSQDMPTRLVSSAYKLLTLLLPYRPTEIWLALRSSNLVTGSSGQASWTKQSAAFNTPSSLLTYECSRGSFPGLQSLLELHATLLAELQRSQFAITPDLLRIKVDVLLRGLNWLCESVWPEHQSWRFNKALDKLTVGTACTRILLGILTDRTMAKGNTREIQESIVKLLVSHAAMLHLAPLINSIASGQEVLDHYHRAGNHAEAEKTHDLTLSSLQLARRIIEQRQELSAAGSLLDRLGLLEKMFFDGSAVSVRSLPSGSRRSARVELINSVFGYLSQGLSIDLCKEAALVITSICLSTGKQAASSASSASPSLSLVGHLGTVDEVKSSMTAILDLLDNTHQDTDLRAATWTMVAALVHSQPALAAMLLSGTGFGGSSSDVEFGAKPQADANSAHENKTALRIAADAVAIWEAYWEGEDVVLLDALLHFLTCVWAQPENSSALEAVRSDEGLWKALSAIITAKIDPAPEDPPTVFLDYGDAEPHCMRTENHEAVRTLSYRMTSKARALYILSSEMENARTSTAKSLECAEALVNRSNEFMASLESVVRFDCDPALHTDVEARMASTFPEVPLGILRNPPKHNEFDLRRTYGDEYVYCTPVLRRKLEGFCDGTNELTRDDASQVTERVIEQAVLLVSGVNLDWSIVDSQATTLRSWTAFVENFAKRIRREHNSQQRARGMQKSCLQAWVTAAKITVSEQREGSIMAGVHAERIKLLQVLLEAAWAHDLQDKKPSPAAAAKTDDVEELSTIVRLVQQLLMHDVFTLQGSIRGSERPPFHNHLLAIVLLCSRRCRQSVPLAQARLRDSQSSVAHKVIHTAIDAFTSHSISALRLVIDSALQLVNGGRKHRAEDLAAVEEELTLVCSVLEVLIRSDVSLAPHFWLNQLQENGVLPACVTLLRRAPRREDVEAEQNVDKSGNITQAPVFMPAILPLLLAMASQQQPAEQAVLAGLMTALTSNALSPFLESGSVAPSAIPGLGGNPAHVCWVTMLRLVVSVVENFDGDDQTGTATWAAASTRFIEMELMGFVRLYGAQLGRALSFSPLTSARLASRPMGVNGGGATTLISLSQLHELHATCRLFLVMASADAFAEGSGREVLSTFAQKTSGILQQLIHLIQRPHQLASLLAGTDHTAMDEDDKKGGSPTSADHQVVISLMSSIASTGVAALWHQTRGLSILASDGGVPPQLSTTPALLRPTMRTSPGQPASIGSLLDLASFHVDKLNSGVGAADGAAVDDVTTIEQSLALAVSQLKLNNLHPAGSKLRRTAETGITRDVVGAIQSALAAMRAKKESTGDVPFLEHLEAVCEGL